MIRYARDFRLIPIVLLATVCLFALKVSGLVLDGGYTLGERLAGLNKTDMNVIDPDTVPETPKIVMAGPQPERKLSWAQEMFNSPAYAPSDITGSVGAAKPAEPPPADAKKKPENPPKDPGGTVISVDPPKVATAGERAVLERLQDRRQEIEGRARELEMRENLLKQAEQRLEAKLMELKALDAKLNGDSSARGKAEGARFKSLVSMYENMKPKDAARIFDRLELKVLMDVTSQINPRKMSDILAQMSPDTAEKLTMELAKTASPDQASPMSALPKIQGRGADEKPGNITQKGS